MGSSDKPRPILYERTRPEVFRIRILDFGFLSSMGISSRRGGSSTFVIYPSPCELNAALLLLVPETKADPTSSPMPNIHPTAVVENGAVIAESVEIGPHCYVGPKITIGSGTRLISHVVITGRTSLGEKNTIWPFSVLGADPQDLKFQGEDVKLIIGDHNEFREHVTLHMGTLNGGGITYIGSDNLIMVGAHVAHDCRIADHCVISNSVQLGGHIQIEDHVTIGGATAVHHFVSIGQFAFVGGMARITKDVPPFMKVEGNPARVFAPNAIGMERHRFGAESIAGIKDAFRRLYRNQATEGSSNGTTNMTEAIGGLEADYPEDACMTIFCRFLRNTSIGLHGRYLEMKRDDNKLKSPAR